MMAESLLGGRSDSRSAGKGCDGIVKCGVSDDQIITSPRRTSAVATSGPRSSSLVVRSW
jgi:hypothetical protein